MTKGITAATDATFDEQLVSDIPVLVKFGAEWCGPCKVMEAILPDLTIEYEGKIKFVTVDIDSTTVASKFGIRGIPTVLIFKNGGVVNTLVGGQQKGRLQLAIDTVLA